MVDILLVEDDPGDAELTIRALKKHGLANNLVHLEDGQAALDFIFSNDPAVVHENLELKVIVLDLKLPRISGAEVLRKIKADPVKRMIPVVIMSSSQEITDISRCYGLGANSYIVKPLELDAFVKVVGELGNYWVHTNQSNC